MSEFKLHLLRALRLILAFMMIACLLSMWITNSAVTAMLLPIVRSILNEIFENVIKE